MLAAVLREFGTPLALEERDPPSCGEGNVLVRVRATGLCGTDLKVIAGTLPGLVLPLVPGHEVAGEVVEGEAGLLGRRVACYLYEPCGRCRACLRGAHALCAQAGRVGRSRDGGLAELIVMRSEDVFPFDGIDDASAAVAMDAVATPWRALRVRARLEPGERVLISGAGGLGLNAVQVARDAGAEVAVLDPAPAARARALALGAILALAPAQVEALESWSAGGVEVGLEASGKPEGLAMLVSHAAPGARIVCCGYSPAVSATIASMQLVLGELSLLGSRASSREDARAALAAVEAGRIRPVIDRTYPLEEVNVALARLSSGEATGRLVITP